MIAGKTWREIRVMALAYLVILELLCVPVLLLWPDIYADLQRSTLMKNLGIDFLKRIGEGISNRDEQIAYTNWCAVMLFFRSTNLVGTAAAVLLGTGLFARERENSTFEFLLSRPVSRRSILWQKWWPCAVSVVVPIYLVSASALFWSARIELELPLWELFLCSTHAAVFALFFLTATTWLSVQLRVQAHVAAAIGAVAIVQIGIYLTQRLRPYSLFRLVDFEWYSPIMNGNTPAWMMFDPVRGPGNTTWLLLATVILYLLAARALRRAEP
ncbi:MAG: ABC transporter permease [Planctomycetes bacterium]|jgi:ABC-type transport system involved in multi-copper enzyme maturation permease subunit|nr:ABC transporter permease [Planctomycetota bacterium]